MNRSVLARVLVVLGMVLAPASFGAAAVLSRDWKTPGDGLLTYDTVNQREWLDFPVTRLSQFPVGTPIEREPKYQYVISQTGPGGLFAGFTSATSQDVRQLALSAGIDVDSHDFSLNQAATTALIDLLGATFDGPGLGDSSAAHLADFAPPPRASRRGAMFRVNPQVSQPTAGLAIGGADGIDGFSTRFSGVALYRHAVPEPSAYVSAIFGSLLLHLSLNARRLQY